MSEPRVILYSQPACPPCFAARSYLKARGIAFDYRDVHADPAAMQELLALQSRSTPTIVVDGEVMVGFDPERLDLLLAER
jgi:glutaredoxin-like YruB-family protein